ncbi:MAG: DNA internalization-related competence protein ComEC/Rec2 [Candidatus Binatales bacterium]
MARLAHLLPISEIPPIYCVALAIVAGDGLGNLGAGLPLSCAIIAAIGAAALLLARHPAAGISIALLGIAAASTIPVHELLAPPLGSVSIRRFADGARVTIEGRLVREAEPYHGRTHLYVGVERAGEAPAAMQPARGTVRVTALYPAGFKIGEQVRVTSRIRFPRNYGNPDEFDYEAYQAREAVAATMVVTEAPGRAGSSSEIESIGYARRWPASAIEEIRARIGASIDANLESPEREEMRALLIGDQGGIDESLRDDFALTGMAHLLVISGLHLSFVAAATFAAARLVLALFPILMIRGYANKLAAIAAAVAVTAYAAIAGHHVSTARALVMVLAYLFAVMIDRAREVPASLALAAIVICFAIPGSTADIGFQLSFVSVIAIVLGMRRFARWRERRLAVSGLALVRESIGRRAAAVILGYCAVSFWAMLGTAPLTAYHFNQFAMVGVIANAVVVPVMGFAGVTLGLAGAATSFVCAPVARGVLRLAGRFLAAGTWLARWFVGWPFAWTRTFTPTVPELAIAYGFLALWLCWPLSGSDRPPEQHSNLPKPAPPPSAPRWRIVVLSVLGVALALDAAWWTRDRYFNPDLRITFVSVGQGDCAVIRFPDSRVMLVDGGGELGEFDPGERIVAPYLWSRKIMHVDYLALSHPELDHFGGFGFIARNFHPEEFWTIPAASPDRSYLELLGELAQAGTRVRIVDSSFAPATVGGVALEFLNPRAGEVASRNDSSMVVKMIFGATAVLFTGDLEAKGERSLIATRLDLRATVLKAPHHGSASSSTEAFVEMVHPAIAIISDGYHNRFGFPAPEVLDRYRRIGADLLRTDQNGAIEIDASRTSMSLRIYGSR